MKKLLSFLVSIGLTATAGSGVVACGISSKKSSKQQEIQFAAAPELKDNNQIWIELKGLASIERYTWISPKKVKVQDNKVREAYISMTTLEISFEKEILPPTDNKTLKINIEWTLDSGKILKTALVLTGEGGQPANKIPSCAPKGKGNETLEQFTFETQNISNINSVDITFTDKLPEGMKLLESSINDNVLTLKFNEPFKRQANDVSYRFKFTVGQIIINSEIIIYKDDTLPSFSNIEFIDGKGMTDSFLIVKGTNLDKLEMPRIWPKIKPYSISPNDLSWSIIGVKLNDDDHSLDSSQIRIMVSHDEPLPTVPEKLKLVYDYQGVHVEGEFTVCASN